MLRLPLLLLSLVVLGHAIWAWRERAALDSTLTALKAAGEPVTVADLTFDSVPPDRNASLDYKAALKLIDQSTPAWRKWDNSRNGDFLWPFNAAEQTAARNIIAENGAALSRVDAARNKTAGGWQEVPTVYMPTLEREFFNTKGERALGVLLWLSARQAHLDGDDALALDRLADDLAFADACEKRPTGLGHGVALGMTRGAADSVWTLAPDLKIGPGGASRAKAAALIANLLDEAAMDAGSKLAWRSDRIAALRGLDDFAAGRVAPFSFTFDGTPELARVASGYVLKPTILRHASRVAGEYQDMITTSQAPDWPTAQTLIPNTAGQQTAFDPVDGLFTPSTGSIERNYHAKAERRLAAVALSARLYEIDHDGRLPPTLADLVPAYLPALPIDPLSGKPLLYKIDNPRVYSVGDDGIDDGGVEPEIDWSTGGGVRPIPSSPRTPVDIVVFLHAQPRPQRPLPRPSTTRPS